MRPFGRGRAILILAALLLLAPAAAQAAPRAAVQTTVVDSGSSGGWNAITLDAEGNPVIAYHESGLKLAHCQDRTCQTIHFSLVLNDGHTGFYNSVTLDAAGNPVISYYETSSNNLWLVHCNDPDCSGGGESNERVDGTDHSGFYTSLKLDASGYPVIAYYNPNDDKVRLAHCNDADCNGGDESIEVVEINTGGTLWLALDKAGHPVISYEDVGSDDLWLVHCNDADCSGSNETTNQVDGSGHVGEYNSLALDKSGNPVISYTAYGPSTPALKLAHCNDPDCSSATISQVDGSGIVFYETSLALSADGNPIIGFGNITASIVYQLNLARCNDPDCSGGDEDVQVLASGSVTGIENSMVLDCGGNPLIAYRGGPLSLAYDDSTDCSSPPAAGQQASKAIAESGVTTLQHGRILVRVPATAIPEGETDCKVVIRPEGDSGGYGFSLDDTVWDVKIECAGGKVAILYDAISVCIRPQDGEVADKQVFHRHSNAFTALASTGELSGYVCGQTRSLSLFTLGEFSLPATGFAPGGSALAAQTAAFAYTATDLTLSIPELGVEAAIVGVPQTPNGWDVSWLGDSVGYLAGTAFPTLAGNTVLTGHVWGADNQPGPFARLDELGYGDRFSILAWGQTYTYEVRSNRLIAPDAVRALGHEEYDWVTLLTCQNYDEASGEYRYRRAVRAVLVSVE